MSRTSAAIVLKALDDSTAAAARDMVRKSTLAGVPSEKVSGGGPRPKPCKESREREREREREGERETKSPSKRKWLGKRQGAQGIASKQIVTASQSGPQGAIMIGLRPTPRHHPRELKIPQPEQHASAFVYASIRGFQAQPQALTGEIARHQPVQICFRC